MTPEPAAITAPTTEAALHLLRRVGLFDAIMIVMGGIVDAGIFTNRYAVARQVHMPVLILAVRVAGGVVAMLGAFVYAELATSMPNVGGQYAYLRDAFHPVAGFLYGWVLLLVIQTGGMAAVTVTFARYFLELTTWPISAHPAELISVIALDHLEQVAARA
jgi:APA family basic amino acid/polyamine antiporter